VIGHFDLIRMWRPLHPLSPPIWAKIRRNIDLIIEYDGIVEINSRGWKKGLQSPYPLNDILVVMMKAKVRFTLSDDSHGPNDVGYHYEKLIPYIRDLGIEQVWVPGMASPFLTRDMKSISHSQQPS
jgi:histidinol-phosphatase (PHP family)